MQSWYRIASLMPVPHTFLSVPKHVKDQCIEFRNNKGKSQAEMQMVQSLGFRSMMLATHIKETILSREYVHSTIF
jgi:hypothetical protein